MSGLKSFDQGLEIIETQQPRNYHQNLMMHYGDARFKLYHYIHFNLLVADSWVSDSNS